MHKKAARKLAALVAQLEALYAQLPTVVCQGKCWRACRSIPLAHAEALRLQEATHRKPRTVDAETRCIYLTPEGRCDAYAARPLICRAFGVTASLSCPFGCEPTEWMDMGRFLRLARAVERLAGQLLRTTDAGLEPFGDGYLSIPQTRSDGDIARDATLTRNLRALHGGYILVALHDGPALAGHEPKP